MKKIDLENLRKARRKNRNRAKIFGTAETPRLSVFRSNKETYVQLIDDNKSRTVISASTKEIKAKDKKTEKAKKLGELVAEKAIKAGIKKAIFNKGQYAYHGRVKAVAEGAREKGLTI
ncbi:MAG: 50S ribosomal protein L18 [Candidatus Pacebacteria bacterium]|nr:50S ribosomal protein L18 [Candidatus Paceibacterota bacterium]